MTIVTSSYQRITSNERYQDKAALNWFNNTLMGFGAKNIGYYTYHVKDDSAGEIHANNGSFINRQGEKTELYYNVQEQTAKSQVLAPVILNFDYQASLMYNNDCSYRENWDDGQYQDPFWAMDTYENKAAVSKFNDAVIKKNASGQYLTLGDNFMGLLTELKDSATGNHMYMVMNTIAPYYTAADATTSATVRFQANYTHAWVFFDGQFTVKKLDSDGGLTFTMKPGEAYYVIPYSLTDADITASVDGTDYIGKPNTNWNGYWGR